MNAPARLLALADRQRGVARYVATAAMVLLAAFCHGLLRDLLDDSTALMLFLLPVAVASILWGLVPGLFATAAGLGLSLYAFFAPTLSLAVQRADLQLSALLFLVLGTILANVGERVCAARRLLRERARDLQRRDASLRAALREREEALAAARRAADELECVDRRKDEFIATLAHELRNPLAAIRYAATLLGPGVAPDAVERVRDMVARQSRHVSRLLDDLLDLARVARGAVELRAQRLDMRDLVRDALEGVRATCDEREHRVEIDLPAEPAPVVGDATRLMQVLSNLLVNAARYTPPGGRIEVAVRSRGESVELTVRDDGIGIARDRLTKIFEPFERGGQHSEGLGIGLAVVRRLVELHGGAVVAESAGPGFGTTFRIRLPVATAGNGRPAGRSIPRPARTPAATPELNMERPDSRPADRAQPAPARPSERAQPASGADPARDAELDKQLKDTFPASDPVPPKHVD